MAELPELLYKRLKIVLKNKSNLHLHEPNFLGNEWKYVKECIDTGWVSSVGDYVNKFENQLSNYTNSYAILTNSGTSALHISLIILGVKSGDEVVLPSLSFVATANAISYCGAYPHFVDTCQNEPSIDPNFLRSYLSKIGKKTENGFFNKITGKKIAAIIPVHVFGHPTQIEDLVDLSKEFNIPLVEDAAESLGSFFRKKHTGTFGNAGVISFNGNKIISTGSGGAILLKSKILAKKAKHLTTTAKKKHDWNFFHDNIGWNYRMPNINAALGSAQLEKIEDYIKLKRKLAKKYELTFKDDKNFNFLTEPSESRSNYWLCTILVKNASYKKLNQIIRFHHEKKIFLRPAWTLLNKLPMYNQCPKSRLPNSEKFEKSIINLPSSSFIEMETDT